MQVCLTHFMSLVLLYISLKHQKTRKSPKRVYLFRDSVSTKSCLVLLPEAGIERVWISQIKTILITVQCYVFLLFISTLSIESRLIQGIWSLWRCKTLLPFFFFKKGLQANSWFFIFGNFKELWVCYLQCH